MGKIEELFPLVPKKDDDGPFGPDQNIWDYAFDSWDEVDPAKLKRRRWLYGKHYLLGTVSAIIADGGVGKSILRLTESIAIITGLPLLGITPAAPEVEIWDEDGVQKHHVPPHQVLYFNAEESCAEIELRVCAICQYYGIDLHKLKGRLTIVSGHDFPMVLGRGRNGIVTINEELFGRLEAYDGNVITLDPFVSIHQCPEDDNDSIDVILKQLGRLASTGAKAIALAHHPRKRSGEVTGIDARGASSIYAGVRALQVGNPMTEAEAKRLKVDDPTPYFRINGDKANYSARSSSTQWFKHQSVILPNGEDVGVIVPWKAPGLFDAVTPQRLQDIRDLANGGGYRVDPKATETWIGNAVADVLGLDIESEVDRDEIKTMLAKWYEDGVLKKVEQWDKNRNKVLFAKGGK
jgi:hypothetical protein